MAYQLLPIDQLWLKRYEYGSGAPYAAYSAIFGLDGDDHQAHAPWGIYDEKRDNSHADGLWFENPYEEFHTYFSGFSTGESRAYVYRSVDGHFETFHDYGDSDVRYEWSQPGSLQGKISFYWIELEGPVGSYPGDAIRVKGSADAGWTSVPTYGGWDSPWLAGDRVIIEFDVDNDGNGSTDWGFYIDDIDWQ